MNRYPEDDRSDAVALLGGIESGDPADITLVIDACNPRTVACLLALWLINELRRSHRFFGAPSPSARLKLAALRCVAKGPAA